MVHPLLLHRNYVTIKGILVEGEWVEQRGVVHGTCKSMYWMGITEQANAHSQRNSWLMLKSSCRKWANVSAIIYLHFAIEKCRMPVEKWFGMVFRRYLIFIKSKTHFQKYTKIWKNSSILEVGVCFHISKTPNRILAIISLFEFGL